MDSSKGIDETDSSQLENERSDSPPTPTTNPNNVKLLVTNPDFLNMKTILEGDLQRELDSRMGYLKTVEAKCNLLLEKFSDLDNSSSLIVHIDRSESQSDEVIRDLRRDLEDERGERRELEQNFMECVDKLMHEIVQLSLKIVVLEERIEGFGKWVGVDLDVPPPEDLTVEEMAVNSNGTTSGGDNDMDIDDTPTEPESSSPAHSAESAALSPSPSRRKSAHDRNGRSKSGSPGAGTGTGNKGKRLYPKHDKDPSRPLHCKCGQKCSNNLTLYDHIRYYTAKNKFLSCKSCGKQFVYSSLLNAHLKQAHGRKLELSFVEDVDQACRDEEDNESPPNDQVAPEKVIGGLGTDGNRETGSKCKLCGKSFKASKDELNCNICQRQQQRLECKMCSQQDDLGCVDKVEFRQGYFGCRNCSAMFSSMKQVHVHRAFLHRNDS